jgi:hypothetical protein
MDVSFDSIEREEGTGAPKMRGRLPAARIWRKARLATIVPIVHRNLRYRSIDIRVEG